MAGESGTNFRFIGLIVAVATIGGFMFGYDSGAINGTQDGLRHAFGLTDAQLGLTVSALLPGCAVGAFLAGRFADVFGRRNVLMQAAVLFIISAFACGAAPSATLLAIARFLAGAAVGAASVLSPAYISEVTRDRGRRTSMLTLAINRPEFCDVRAASGRDPWVSYHVVDNPLNAKFAAVSFGTAGLRLFDIRDPARPVEVAYFNHGPLQHAGVSHYDAERGLLYVPGATGLQVLQLQPQVLKRLYGKKSHNPFLKEDS